MDVLPCEGADGATEMEAPQIAQGSDGGPDNETRKPQENPSAPMSSPPAPGDSKLEGSEQKTANMALAGGGSPSSEPVGDSQPQTVLEFPAGLPGELPPGPRYK